MNTNHNPVAASASRSRDNPCFGNDPSVVTLNVFTDDAHSYQLPYAQFLYAEDQARYLIALPSNKVDALDQRARTAGVHYLVIGEAGGRELSYVGASGQRERLALDELRSLNESWLPAYMKVAH